MRPKQTEQSSIFRAYRYEHSCGGDPCNCTLPLWQERTLTSGARVTGDQNLHNESIIVSAQALCKRYGKQWALNDLNLSIPRGSSVALVGSNGAGKTTFLKCIAGLVHATSGSISVLGRTPDLDEPKHTAQVSYLDQRHPLYGFLRVNDTLKLGAELNPNWNVSESERGLEVFQLQPRKKVKDLSGGQHAQLALVLALNKSSQVLLLDEPMASLDPLARTLSRQLIDTARAHTSLLIVSSHIVSELEEMCDYLVLMARGRVALAGRFTQLLDSWRSGSLRLEGSPVELGSSPRGTFGLEELINNVLLLERTSTTLHLDGRTRL